MVDLDIALAFLTSLIKTKTSVTVGAVVALLLTRLESGVPLDIWG